MYTVSPGIVIAITIHFRYLQVHAPTCTCSVTTKRRTNETKVIAIKLSKTNPAKNNRNKG